MFRVLDCITDQHDYRLVLVAIAICALTAYTAWYLYSHSLEERRLKRLGWIFLTAVAAGSGIWSTHFILMLAYDSGLPTVYDPMLTFTSLVVAIFVTGAGFAFAAIGNEWWRRLAGGALIGIGIGAMHYTGMSAVNLPGHINWHIDLVAGSLAVGVAFGIASMWSFHKTRSVVISAGLLTFAICTLHLTAMGAAAVEYDPTVVVQSIQINNSVLGLATACITLLVVLSGLAAALIKTQTERDHAIRVETLHRLAHRDWLTGLPNRAATLQRLQQAIGESKLASTEFAVLFADLDRFKDINDTFGHTVGDQVLREVAKCLRSVVPDDAFVARLGGDEFLIIHTGAQRQDAAQSLACQIVQRFRDAFKRANEELPELSISVGVAVYPRNSLTAEGILRSADIALHQAKRNGRSRASSAGTTETQDVGEPSASLSAA